MKTSKPTNFSISSVRRPDLSLCCECDQSGLRSSLKAIKGEYYENIRSPFNISIVFHEGRQNFLKKDIPQVLQDSNTVHCNGNYDYIFLSWELLGLSPSFHIHVSVSDLNIPRIGPHNFLQQKRQTHRESI